MTETLAPAKSRDEDALALLGGSAYEGQDNYIPSAAFFTCVWAKSGEAAKDAAGAAGYKIGKDDVVFGYTKAGSFEFMRPFSFYLINSEPCFNIKDEEGKSVRLVSEVPPNDSDADKFREGYVALLVAVQGRTLVPLVATVGRFEGGLGKAIKTARVKVQDYKRPDLAERGEQFAIAAKVKAVPYRVQFTLSARPEDGEKGRYLKGTVTSRPVVQSDLDILEANDVTDFNSNFFKDFKETAAAYQAEIARIKSGR